MFTANLSGASVGVPGSVTINLAASDAAALPAVPTLSWWGMPALAMQSQERSSSSWPARKWW